MGENKNNITFIMPWHISERGGGAEVQANYLSQELGARNFQVSYVCQTIHKSKVDTVEVIDNITIHWLKPSGKFHWVDQNKYYLKLIEIRPKIVIQRLSSNVSFVIGKYCSKYNAKFIWICTDNMSPYKNYHVRKFKNNNNAKKVGLLKYHLFLKNAEIMDWYRNQGMKQVDVAFTQNDNQYKILKNAFNILSKRMISGHKIPEIQLNPASNFSKKTIIWCGNFGQNKRPKLFIELATNLKDEHLNFIMIGSHSNKAYVHSILKEKPDNLVATGQLSFEESLNHFNSATLFVNTSKSEGFSNTYIQSWLRGVPTLVFGADPNNVIKNNSLGYVAKDVSDATKYIKTIFSDFEKYEILSRNTKDFAMANHTVKKMTDHFLKAIKL